MYKKGLEDVGRSWVQSGGRFKNRQKVCSMLESSCPCALSLGARLRHESARVGMQTDPSKLGRPRSVEDENEQLPCNLDLDLLYDSVG